MPLSPEEKQLFERLKSEASKRGIQLPSQGPATIGEMRRREEQGQVAALPPEQVQSQLQEAVDQSNKIGYATAAARAGGGFIQPPFETTETAKESLAAYGRIVPVGIAGMLTAGAGIVPTAAAMGATGLLADAATQGLEISSGKRPEFKTGEMLKSAIVAATPGLGPIKGVAGPLGAAFYQAGKQSLLNASTAAFGEVIQKYIDQDRLPTRQEILNEVKLPALFGAVTGGASGALGRSPRALTTEEQIAEQGRQASQRLETTLGPQTAPLTATQQTGRNVPGTFGPGTSGLATQQGLVERVRTALGLKPDQDRIAAQAIQQELIDAEGGSRQVLRGSAAGAGGEAVTEVEGVIGSILPSSPRAKSLQQAANNSVGFIQGEEQRLSDVVDATYNTARTTRTTNLAGKPEIPVTPSQNLRDSINEVLGNLATEEITTVTPSLVPGGTPITTIERIPSQFFDEPARKARSLLDVASSPQTFDQIVGLRQNIDSLIHRFQEFAPGFAQNQLGRLRSALKQEELASARRLGIEPEIVSAQKAAENRFDLLQNNQIIRKATIPAKEGGYQNTEEFFSELAKSPAAFESIQNLLNATAAGKTQFNLIRRGFIDSLRSANTVDVAGVPTENLSSFATSFRELPQGVKNIVAGNEGNANRLQSILNDAVRTQNVGMSIPIATGITSATLSEIVDNLPNIASGTLRRTVSNLAIQARDRARDFFNKTTIEVQKNRLNPDIDPTQFVRDFVFKSENPKVVQDALNLLSPVSKNAMRENAAVAVLNYVSETGPSNLRNGINSLDDIFKNPNRMQIIKDVLRPDDFKMINDYMQWNRARNLTIQGAALEPNQLANSVMKAFRARWLVDTLVGSPTVQNFLSSAVRLPQTFANLKPNLTLPQAERFARASNMSLLQFNKEWDNLNKKSEEAKASLPEDKRDVFEDTLGVPARPRF
jgi:hypothetical protein